MKAAVVKQYGPPEVLQLARYFGARVTGVCSTGNLEMVKSLGAENVIDYTREDFTRQGATYDIIFDTVAKSSFSRCRGALKENGMYITTVPTPAMMLGMLVMPKKSGKRAAFAAAGLRPSDEKAGNLGFLAGLVREKKLITVIDRKYSLEDISEARRYVEQGHKRGNAIPVI